MAKSKHRPDHKKKLLEHQIETLQSRLEGYRNRLATMQAEHAKACAAADATLKELEKLTAEIKPETTQG
jgi:chaperonin cofactor prefoldin